MYLSTARLWLLRLALDSTGQAANDLLLENGEADQRGNHRQRGEGQYLSGIDRMLGAEHLHAERQGVLAGIVLGVGRAIGETMAVVMIAGNQTKMPSSIFKGVRTMTANIVMEMGYATGLHREALIATGVVLFVFILLINAFVAAIKKKGVEHA